MGSEKLTNLFLILAVILVIIGIPYLLYTLGTFIEINYFGYINNWWIVLLFTIILLAIFILGGINLDKNMGYFFLFLFTISFFILGFRLGVKPNIDMESYALLLDKEKEIDQLDSLLINLENKSLEEQDSKNTNFKNHEIIFFDAGHSEISDFNQQKITAFVSNLENCRLNIYGYSDDSGNRSYNKDISNERAQNVADFVKSINHQNNTINEVSGFGDEHQLVENKDEISRSKNRRVSIEIVSEIDEAAEASRKKIRDEIDKNRAIIKNIKVQRDSLMNIISQGTEE